MTPTLTTGKAALDYGWLEKQWEITVSPVPQERKHLIKTLLEREALPIARAWLVENGARNEFGSITLTFEFDEESESLIEERDSRLSPKQA